MAPLCSQLAWNPDARCRAAWTHSPQSNKKLNPRSCSVKRAQLMPRPVPGLPLPVPKNVKLVPRGEEGRKGMSPWAFTHTTPFVVPEDMPRNGDPQTTPVRGPESPLGKYDDTAQFIQRRIFVALFFEVIGVEKE